MLWCITDVIRRNKAVAGRKSNGKSKNCRKQCGYYALVVVFHVVYPFVAKLFNRFFRRVVLFHYMFDSMFRQNGRTRFSHKSSTWQRRKHAWYFASCCQVRALRQKRLRPLYIENEVEPSVRSGRKQSPAYEGFWRYRVNKPVISHLCFAFLPVDCYFFLCQLQY